MNLKDYGNDDVWALRKSDACAVGPTSALRGSDWAKDVLDFEVDKPRNVSATEWYIECHLVGLAALAQVIEIDTKRQGGVPVLVGTRFTVAQVLAELAETAGVEAVALEFDLNAETIRDLLNGLSLIMQRPCFEE